MHRGWNAQKVAILGAIGVSLAGYAQAADSASSKEQSKGPAANSATSAGKPRTGVRIELTLPQLGSKPKDANSADGKSWPKTLPEAQAESQAKTRPPATWSPEEIAVGRARCQAILKRIDAVAIPQEPIRQGNCGTPAPIQLVSIGRNPQVSLSPPATINCDLAESLQSWLEEDVQPLARKHMGQNVIKIEVMSSYSCRNAYGRTGNKLSEHGRANALDIRGFVTSTGKTAYVLEDWGTTQREIAARVAAEKAKAAQALAEQQAAEKAAAAQAAGRNAPAASASNTGSGVARSTISEGLPRLTITLPGSSGGNAGRAPSMSEGFSMAPSRLGGPKPADLEDALDDSPGDIIWINQSGKDAITAATTRAKPQEAAPIVERKQAFLHAVHDSACRRFGTTLGPEANSAHRNHLHVDLAMRNTNTKICD